MCKEDLESLCPKCGSSHTVKNGRVYSRSKESRRQAYKCVDCKDVFRSEQRELSPPSAPKVDLEAFTYQDQPIPSQDWSAYTQAQNNEKRLLMEILSELLLQVRVDVPESKKGRHYSDMKDLCFSVRAGNPRVLTRE